MHALIALAEREDYGVYILGARREVLETAVRRLRETHPRLRIAGYRDGSFSDEQSPAPAAAIRGSRAHILFVAMSTPRKEHRLGEHGPCLGVPFAMGVGGAAPVSSSARLAAVRAPLPVAGHGSPAPTALVAGAGRADATQMHTLRFEGAAAGRSRSIAAWCASRDAS
jgi:UDP-N-acetyl-D-mannosaminuronic acid transferase (WecB/TagA/CpsF family)